MIFKQDMLALVLAGKKTQTRRRVTGPACFYKPGSTHPVTLQRGGQSYGRIRVILVEHVPAHEISEGDAVAEGFASPEEFLERWRQMHGYPTGYAWKITFELFHARVPT